MKRTLANLARVVAAVAVTATLSMAAMPASAQAVCSSREQMADLLRTRFDETLTAAGVDQNGNLVQVFNSTAGSWTIVVTIAGGPTCLLSAGDGWTYAESGKTPVENRGS